MQGMRIHIIPHTILYLHNFTCDVEFYYACSNILDCLSPLGSLIVFLSPSQNWFSNEQGINVYYFFIRIVLLRARQLFNVVLEYANHLHVLIQIGKEKSLYLSCCNQLSKVL